MPGLQSFQHRVVSPIFTPVSVETRLIIPLTTPDRLGIVVCECTVDAKRSLQ